MSHKEIMLVVFIAAVLAAVVYSARVLFHGWLRRNTEDMVTEYMRRFPGKCMICSFHRYGWENGFSVPGAPAAHDCIDKENEHGSQEPPAA